MKRAICVLLVIGLTFAFAFADESAMPTDNTESQVETVAETSVEPEPTPEPTAESVSEVSETGNQPTPTPIPTVEATSQPSSGNCWLLDDNGERDERGDLSEMLKRVGRLSIQVSATQTVVLRDFPLARLGEITLTPDPDVFEGDYRVVCSASTAVADEYTQKQISSFSEEDSGDVYIWVQDEDEEPEPTPTAEPVGIRLTVDARDYYADTWSNVQPRFELKGIPEGDDAHDYWLVQDKNSPKWLADGEYLPYENGEYSVRFVIEDEQGDVVSKSEIYYLKLDFTAPELSIEVSGEKSYSMTIRCSDEGSGFGAESLSLDGGATWLDANDYSEYEYTTKKKTVFPAGSILLRDMAGNVSTNEDDITLSKISSWSGGSGSSDAATQKEHASGDGDTTVYNSYDMQLPDGEMTQLSFGGEAVDLTLTADDETEQFSGSLIRWARSENAVDTDEKTITPDTLVLTADTAAHDGSECTYSWKINGAVLRKLYNSDINYLALRVGQSMVSLPTAGFSGGTRYAEMKMDGVSTAAFEYEIRMTIDPDSTTDALHPGKVSIVATVNGEQFEMGSRSQTPEMYLCDVWDGPTDLPDYPYGEYPGLAETEE